MKDEVNQLMDLGVLIQANDLQWVAPSFLNKHVVRHPFPLLSIPETNLTIIKFT